MQKCANETEAAVLSKHLWNATSTGSAYAKAQFPYRYQSPIVGGDDLLLFLPNRRCVHTLWEIWTQVEERLKSPPPELQRTAVGKALEQEVSLSIGMLVADHHLPIPFLFETARMLPRITRSPPMRCRRWQIAFRFRNIVRHNLARACESTWNKNNGKNN